jgi:starch synthase (maltosyl-transferring)
LVADAQGHGIEIALDLALQCSVDHPWLTEHPEWFAWRDDGTIKFAENPPKRYEDIVNFDFGSSASRDLQRAVLDIVQHWVGHGVRVFRVDNPHTKPIGLWEWLLGQVHARRPDVIFLAEAFTRPAVMKLLAKSGFNQSYTYFTWRNDKREITTYLEELAGEMHDYFRPNFFVNTPDILTEYLQEGGPPAFAARAVLAATLSPSYGVYSGFENFENRPAAPGSEEYLNSEKYEVKQRRLDGPLLSLFGRLNSIRRSSPAFAQLDNLRFVSTSNDQIIGYVKDGGQADRYLICVNLDPHAPHEGLFEIPDDMGFAEDLEVRDVLNDVDYSWQRGANYVRLEPGGAHVMRVN